MKKKVHSFKAGEKVFAVLEFHHSNDIHKYSLFTGTINESPAGYPEVDEHPNIYVSGTFFDEFGSVSSTRHINHTELFYTKEEAISWWKKEKMDFINVVIEKLEKE